MTGAAFPTELGWMAVRWDEGGALVRLVLPEADEPVALGAVGEASATAPPMAVAAVIARIQAIVAGGPADDLLDVAVSLPGRGDLDLAIYDATRRIPPGETTTYGALAASVGSPGAAQAVGRAMAKNPVPFVIPCHRVLAADGSLHGFSATGGLVTKRRLLELEGATAVAARTLFD